MSSPDTRPISPVAYAENVFDEKFGIPRQSGRASSVVTKIVFLPEYRNPDALREIEGFSHLWLIFGFSESLRDGFTPTVRPPRLGGNRRVGVFASRSPFRPNGLGLSSVKLEAVKADSSRGTYLEVTGADLLNGTPIYDIKPYLPLSDMHTDAVGGYSDSERNHKLNVSDPSGLLDTLPEEISSAACECIADDPRPSYQNDPAREYVMRLSGFDIGFRVEDNDAYVTSAVTVNEGRK